MTMQEQTFGGGKKRLTYMIQFLDKGREKEYILASIKDFNVILMAF
jgi:hypothetical protein